jgi:hypothetical protein
VNYAVIATSFRDMDRVRASAVTTAPEIDFVGARSATGPGLFLPPQWAPLDKGSFGPNFQFAVVPEPGGFVILLAGITGVVTSRASGRHRTARRPFPGRDG